jgi:hypothetical protein
MRNNFCDSMFHPQFFALHLTLTSRRKAMIQLLSNHFICVTFSFCNWTKSAFKNFCMKILFFRVVKIFFAFYWAWNFSYRLFVDLDLNRTDKYVDFSCDSLCYCSSFRKICILFAQTFSVFPCQTNFDVKPHQQLQPNEIHNKRL